VKGLLGIKLGMTQVFDELGVVTPVTVIQAGPCYVTQVKTQVTDGYDAVQLGFGPIKENKLTRGEKGHLGLLAVDEKPGRRQKSGRRSAASIPALRYLREFRTQKSGEHQVGQQLTVEQFTIGDRVDVIGKTKGRGFTGAVKRYGFAGGIKTHGQSDRHRATGSVGATSGTAHVFKGKRMPGRMGNERLTAQNLEVVSIDAGRHLIAVKGSVPGTKGGFIMIRDAAKN
jgi:large subunit ribosomal protein L3